MSKSLKEEHVHLSDRDHLLLKPETKIGDVRRNVSKRWIGVLNNDIDTSNDESKSINKEESKSETDESKEKEVKKITKKVLKHVFQMMYLDVDSSQALLTTIGEIVLNALDRVHWDPTMNRIDIDFHEMDKQQCSIYNIPYTNDNVEGAPLYISVKNNGHGIGAATMKTSSGEEKPKVVVLFGEFNSSSNFTRDKNSKHYTGGQFGYGATTTNVFAKYFEVDTAEGKQKIVSRWENNANLITGTKRGVVTYGDIKSYGGKKGYTKVSWVPDLIRFGFKGSKLLIPQLENMVLNLAACTPAKVSVYMNKKAVSTRHFVDYVKLWKESESMAIDSAIDEDELERFSCAIFPKPTELKDDVSNVGFINGVPCPSGTHIDQVYRTVSKLINTKLRCKDVTSKMVQSVTTSVVKATWPSPSFRDPTKQELVSPWSSLNLKWTPSKKFVNAVHKHITPLIKHLIDLKKKTEDLKVVSASLKETGSSGAKTMLGRTPLMGIPKFENAQYLGTNRRSECALLIAEGDSAKKPAENSNRDFYALFALRGKPRNTLGISPADVIKNEEMKNLIRILNLKFDVDYRIEKNRKTLNVSSLVIVADQDHDGAHIVGLIITLFVCHFPTLLQGDPCFIKRFITPIIKATYKKKVYDFYSQDKFERWVQDHGGYSELKGLKTKYYKGLGTFDSKEAKELFQKDIKKCMISLKYQGKETDELIQRMFDDGHADSRKDLVETAFREYGKPSEDRLEMYRPIDYQDMEHVNMNTYLMGEVIPFFAYSNERTIPNMMDGLKTSLRKIIYFCLKNNVDSDIKVSQLKGKVSESLNYHHGEESLAKSISNLCRSFVGTNNMALLYPSGQHGTRHSPAPSADRYIFTRMDKIMNSLFKKADNPILNIIEEEGDHIEPKYLLPILPMLLVNGSKAIGTGFASDVPSHDPLDLMTRIELMLKHGPNYSDEPIVPWFDGFHGSLELRGTNAYATSGRLHFEEHECEGMVNVVVTELPIGVWSQAWKASIENKYTISVAEANAYMNANGDLKKSKNGKNKKRRIDESNDGGSYGGSEESKSIDADDTDDNMSGFTVKSVKKGKGAGKNGSKKENKIKKPKGFIVDAITNNTETSVKITFRCVKSLIPDTADGMLQVLGIKGKVNHNNLTVFDEDCKMMHFDSTLDLLKHFVSSRLSIYEERRMYEISELEKEMPILIAKIKFIEAVLSSSIESWGSPVHVIEEELVTKGFEFIKECLDMSFRSLTLERIEKLKSEVESHRIRIEMLKTTNASQLWLMELGELRGAIEAYRRERFDLMHGNIDGTEKNTIYKKTSSNKKTNKIKSSSIKKSNAKHAKVKKTGDKKVHTLKANKTLKAKKRTSDVLDEDEF